MDLILPRILFFITIAINIAALIVELVLIHPGSFDNYLMLSLITLLQSFVNVLLAGIWIIYRFIVKTKEQKDKISIIINGFWLSAGLALLFAIGYCFVGVPASRAKSTTQVTAPAGTGSTGLGY